MRRMCILLTALVCLLILPACSTEEHPAAWTVEAGEAILDSGAFSDSLEELDLDTAWILYQLEGAGLSRSSLTDGLCRRSAGATCEELALLLFDSADSAKAAQDALKAYIDGQILSNQDYRPSEIPKLEAAWLEQRDNTLLLVVANDLELAKAAVT